jgi:hypothetical protein
MNPINLSNDSKRYCRGGVLRHDWRQYTEGILNLQRTLGDWRMGSKYLERGEMERESETLVLGELNPPNNSRIPQRNQ